MADVNTKYLRRVIIESDNGSRMDDLDFCLEFFVHSNKIQRMHKSDLVRVQANGEANYYAVIDSRVLGRGNVLCRANIVDREPRLKGMKRPVVLVSEVGLIIGIHNCMEDESFSCECYDEGYRIRYEAVSDIPKQDGVGVMYGIIETPIASYADITERMAYGLTAADSVETEIIVKPGDKVVVLVNSDNPNHALKGNGMGGFVSFDASFNGANGEYELTVDGVSYRVYGEMALVNGILTIKL